MHFVDANVLLHAIGLLSGEADKSRRAREPLEQPNLTT